MLMYGVLGGAMQGEEDANPCTDYGVLSARTAKSVGSGPRLIDGGALPTVCQF